MGAWEKLTPSEKECYYLTGNGFKQCEISILKNVETGVIRTHMHNGKIKAESDTPEEALRVFSSAGHIPPMPDNEKKKCRKIVTDYIAKYGPKKG